MLRLGAEAVGHDAFLHRDRRHRRADGASSVFLMEAEKMLTPVLSEARSLLAGFGGRNAGGARAPCADDVPPTRVVDANEKQRERRVWNCG